MQPRTWSDLTAAGGGEGEEEEEGGALNVRKSLRANVDSYSNRGKIVTFEICIGAAVTCEIYVSRLYSKCALIGQLSFLTVHLKRPFEILELI